MSIVEQYRARAQEADLFAKIAATTEHRDAWAKIAEGYRSLADQAERQMALSPLGSLRGDVLLPD